MSKALSMPSLYLLIYLMIVILVSLRCAKTSKDKKRVYDKKQACYYCGNLICKIARHYELKHQSEREVAIALSFNKGSTERKKHLEKLRLLGNYHHNLTVLETGKGELIVMRRPSSSSEKSRFSSLSVLLWLLKTPRFVEAR